MIHQKVPNFMNWACFRLLDLGNLENGYLTFNAVSAVDFAWKVVWWQTVLFPETVGVPEISIHLHSLITPYDILLTALSHIKRFVYFFASTNYLEKRGNLGAQKVVSHCFMLIAIPDSKSGGKEETRSNQEPNVKTYPDEARRRKVLLLPLWRHDHTHTSLQSVHRLF